MVKNELTDSISEVIISSVSIKKITVMNKIQIIRLIIVGFLVNSIFSVNGQEVDLEDLEELSLEDLMSLSITSASKKEENIFEAPSIVTTISASEIEMFGAQDLMEVLERATSFYGLSSVVFPQNSIGLRGDLPTHTSAHILFLIDGRPFREGVKGGQNVSILSTFPIASIQQIEIIRGPGSVLYGSNAYAGVINIITKETETPEITVQGAAGSFGTTQMRVNGGTTINNLQINGALNILNSDGWGFADSVRLRDLNRQFGQVNFGDEAIAGNLNLKYNDFSFSSYFGKNDLDHITPITSLASIYSSQRLFMDIGYNGYVIPDKYRLTINATYNQIRDEFDNGLFNASSTQSIEGDDYVIELTNFFEINDQIELTVGGSAYFLSGLQAAGTDFTVENFNSEWFNGYFQGSYKPKEWLSLVAGAQINKVPNIDLNFVPRLALIGSAKNGFGGKLLFGQAFRAPYAAETNIFGPPSVVGNQNLVPETISTYEAQVFYSNDKGSISMTYFRSHQENLIVTVSNPDPDFDLIFTNLGEQISSGIELEGKYSLTKNFYLNGSYSFQKNEDEDGNENVTRLPQHMLKIGAMYDIQGIVKIAVHNAYYSSPIVSGGLDGLGQLSSFNWTTAKVDFNLNKALSFDHPNVSLNIRSINLLNEKVYNPEIVFANYNAVQSHPEAAYQLGVKVTF